MSAPECKVRELGDGVVGTAVELDAVVTNPDTGEALHTQRASSLESIENPLAAAGRVHDTRVWLELPATERADSLRALGAKRSERVQQLAEADSLDSGAAPGSTAAFAGAGSAWGMSGKGNFAVGEATKCFSGYRWVP